jgi:hypothetical protein
VTPALRRIVVTLEAAHFVIGGNGNGADPIAGIAEDVHELARRSIPRAAAVRAPESGRRGGGMTEEQDLLAEARRRLAELEETDDGDELGERVELDVGDGFLGRWRGEGTMRTKDGDEILVYLLWDEDRPRFHYRNAALVSEIEELKPQVGDDVAIARGEDREFEVKGERRTMKRFAVRVRPCTDPLPGPAPEPAAAADLPF